jgi:rsbT co-antagonist protein RsbR
VGKDQTGKLSIRRDRLARIPAALKHSAHGDFETALRLTEDDELDDFSEVFKSVREFIVALQGNVESKERVLADLQLSQAELEETLEKVRQQQMAIQDLGTPIIDLWDDIITLPIIGFIDSQRAMVMTEKLLQRIVSAGARCVIVDLTGVDTVDSMTANHLVKMTRAAHLLGSYCVVTGIGPEIAQTLIDLGVELGGVVTLRTLKEGLRACFAHLRALDSQTSTAPFLRNHTGG